MDDSAQTPAQNWRRPKTHMEEHDGDTWTGCLAYRPVSRLRHGSVDLALRSDRQRSRER